MKKNQFEEFLKDIHAEDYSGLDDDMSDDFNDWLADLDGEQYLDYGDAYGIWINKQK